MNIVDWVVKSDDVDRAGVRPAVVVALKHRHHVRLADDEKAGADLVRWAARGAPKTGLPKNAQNSATHPPTAARD